MSIVLEAKKLNIAQIKARKNIEILDSITLNKKLDSIESDLTKDIESNIENSANISKKSEKIVMITAYDALFARLFAPFADMILVGDSLNMSFAGRADTLSASLEQMIYHTQAVCAGAPDSIVICDLPFCATTSPQNTLKAATKIYKKTNAAAIKLEGGAEIAQTIRILCENGIAVMGHIGLKPQFARAAGGYKVVGKSKQEAQMLIRDAQAVEAAGAFCIVLEGCKAATAALVAACVSVPVIGIGAGANTDGQVLVWSDMLGLFTQFSPKFVRKYLDGAELVQSAIKKYAQDVQNGNFPSEKESY